MRNLDPETQALVSLAAAIINQAMNAYMSAKRGLQRFPGSEHYTRKLNDEIAFFRSEWFQVLSLGVDPDWLMGELDALCPRTNKLKLQDLRNAKKLEETEDQNED